MRRGGKSGVRSRGVCPAAAGAVSRDEASGPQGT